jgi:hypothetical protein
LDELSGSTNFSWTWKLAKGHSGGILVGIREEIHDVEETELGEHYISMVLINRLSIIRRELVTVYGPALHNLSVEFISELLRKCMMSTLPMLLGEGGTSI